MCSRNACYAICEIHTSLFVPPRIFPPLCLVFSLVQLLVVIPYRESVCMLCE